jgi:hypothetical protein
MMTNKRKRCYSAKFTLPDGGQSFSEIWAWNIDEAEHIAGLRGMGPCTVAKGPRKEFRPTVLATLPGGWMRADVLHSLCYLGFLAARHGAVTAEELVRDGSPLHEFAHMLGAGPNIRGGTMQAILKECVERFEKIIPGMPPADEKLVLPKDDWMAITVNGLQDK